MKKQLLLLPFFLLAMSMTYALSITPDGGFSTTSIQVNITGGAGNTILYSIDGTDPYQNGAIYTEGFLLTQRNSTPSNFAMNTETSLYPFQNPTNTMKASIIRATEVDAQGKIVANITRTFFINTGNFTLPVFSINIEEKYLTSYEEGMFVKGATYYNDLNANGGNPTNPFRNANWNNDSLRFPATLEVYKNNNRIGTDKIIFYTSGRWSSALAKKSVKIKYDKAVGAAQTTMQLFGDDSPASMNKIWLKQGGQDFDNMMMRDCILAEAVTGMNVEETQCSQGILFINGELYGVMNINQDLDAKYFSTRYGINKDDVVLLSEDGIIEEGKAGDDAAYVNLRNWLQNPNTNLTDQVQYENFTKQVNIESLIDYYSIQIFFHNDDFPNDHRLWRNKNPLSQVNGTPYDGRWYFQPKDLDQTAGLYSQNQPTDNTLQAFMNHTKTEWGYTFFLKAMENPAFKQQFMERNIALLNTTYNSAYLNSTVDRLTSERRPEVPKDIMRWNKPGGWENKIIQMKDWLAKRSSMYGSFFIVQNSTQPQDNQTNVCGISDAYTYCINSTMVGDAFSNGCRIITCQKSGVTISMQICSSPQAPPMVNQTPVVNTTNQTNNTPLRSYAVNVSIAPWYPKVKAGGTDIVFVCNQNVNATKFDWYTYQGTTEVSKNLNRPENTVYKTMQLGSYNVTCVARGNPTMNGTLSVTV